MRIGSLLLCTSASGAAINRGSLLTQALLKQSEEIGHRQASQTVGQTQASHTVGETQASQTVGQRQASLKRGGGSSPIPIPRMGISNEVADQHFSMNPSPLVMRAEADAILRESRVSFDAATDIDALEVAFTVSNRRLTRMHGSYIGELYDIERTHVGQALVSPSEHSEFDRIFDYNKNALKEAGVLRFSQIIKDEANEKVTAMLLERLTSLTTAIDVNTLEGAYGAAISTLHRMHESQLNELVQIERTHVGSELMSEDTRANVAGIFSAADKMLERARMLRLSEIRKAETEAELKKRLENFQENLLTHSSQAETDACIGLFERDANFLRTQLRRKVRDAGNPWIDQLIDGFIMMIKAQKIET